MRTKILRNLLLLGDLAALPTRAHEIDELPGGRRAKVRGQHGVLESAQGLLIDPLPDTQHGAQTRGELLPSASEALFEAVEKTHNYVLPISGVELAPRP